MTEGTCGALLVLDKLCQDLLYGLVISSQKILQSDSHQGSTFLASLLVGQLDLALGIYETCRPMGFIP